MRPVNLIPVESRRGEHAPMRTGPLPYLLAAALVLLLIGVTVLVLTGNKIADSKAEVAQLKREDAVAQTRAEHLAPYTQFRALHEQRLETVSSLAKSRFDWERVMRELSLILPDDTWLVSLAATASPDSSTGADSAGGGSGSTVRRSVPGPALEISGCASSQEAVAGFVKALREIDGVTRVGLESSELPESTGGGSEGKVGGEDCRTRNFIAKFDLVVAFDAAPVPSASAGAAAPPVEASETTAAASEESPEGSE
jgi:Tfp pilus assembly protein PilN